MKTYATLGIRATKNSFVYWGPTCWQPLGKCNEKKNSTMCNSVYVKSKTSLAISIGISNELIVRGLMTGKERLFPESYSIYMIYNIKIKTT